MEVLRRGTRRHVIEDEVGEPDELVDLEAGRYRAIYEVKLGAPKSVDAKGESIKYVGQGLGITMAAGLTNNIVADALNPKRARARSAPRSWG